MKKSFIMLLFCMSFMLAGCSNKTDISKSAGKEDIGNTSQEQVVSNEDSSSVETDEPVAEAIQVPSKEQILEAREKVLTGMSDEEIERLTTNIKDLNNTWEGLYFNSDIFKELEDPDSLYWNYIDDSGDIVIGYLQNGDGTTTEETAFNRFDADSFVALIQDMQKSVQNEELYDELELLVNEINAAHETHDVQHAVNMFHILHDMDYFLLRYGIEDVGKYLQDTSFVATYYGSLSMYEAR